MFSKQELTMQMKQTSKGKTNSKTQEHKEKPRQQHTDTVLQKKKDTLMSYATYIKTPGCKPNTTLDDRRNRLSVKKKTH